MNTCERGPKFSPHPKSFVEPSRNCNVLEIILMIMLPVPASLLDIPECPSPNMPNCTLHHLDVRSARQSSAVAMSMRKLMVMLYSRCLLPNHHPRGLNLSGADLQESSIQNNCLFQRPERMPPLPAPDHPNHLQSRMRSLPSDRVLMKSLTWQTKPPRE